MGPTDQQVADSLKRFGHYRTLRTQEVARQGHNDGIGGGHLLAMGTRETWLKNVEGGAKKVDGEWVPEDNPARMDVGWLQISRRYHIWDLDRMPGVKADTWGPVVSGHTAADKGYVPRFSDALDFTVMNMREDIAFADDHNVPSDRWVEFAIVAHNAGQGGALNGYREGNLEKYTAGGDYLSWVMAARDKIHDWLREHDNWRY
jgi:hypothetical protein